jgi:hypothetical protein
MIISINGFAVPDDREGLGELVRNLKVYEWDGWAAAILTLIDLVDLGILNDDYSVSENAEKIVRRLAKA